MKNKGFTLVELLGVITVLIIVLGIVVLGYIKISEGIKLSFYKGLEESISIASGEYYAYNEDKAPKMFGNSVEVTVKELIEGGYIEEVKDRNKESCDLEGAKYSYAIAYKNSYDKTKYAVCLICSKDNYSSECRLVEDYTLKMTPTIGNTKTIYKEGTWTNQDVKLEFKSQNDVKTVLVTGNGETKSCELTKKNDINQCSITINKSGEYKAVGVAENGNRTPEESISILIDKIAPTYDIEEEGTITIDIGNDTPDKETVENKVLNISDGEGSGISTIRYSFEKEGEAEKYIIENILNEGIAINKEVNRGKWILKVEVADKAGNKEIEEVTYIIRQKISAPTNSLCEARTYNGTSQQITKVKEGLGYTLSGYNQTNAGEYTITANLKDYYVWESGNGTFKCSIAKANSSITCANRNYTGSAQNMYSSSSGCTPSMNKTAINADSYTVSCTGDSNHNDSSCTAIMNKVAATINCSNKTYNGTSQQGCSCSGGTIGGSYSATNAGSYTASCKGDKNHTNPADKSWTMNKGSTSISCKGAQNYTGSAIKSYSTSSNCASITNGNPTNAGTYTVTCNGGSNRNSSTCSFTINRVSVGNAPTSPSDKTYNGNNQGSGISCPSGTTSGGTTSAKDVGTYYQTCTPDGNHKWADGTTGAKSIRWKIIAPTPTLSFSISDACPSGKTDGYKKNATVTITCTSTINITGFAVSNGSNSGVLTADSPTSKTATIKLSSIGDQAVTAVCTNGVSTATESPTYKIYTYSSNSSCGVSSTTYSGSCKCIYNYNGERRTDTKFTFSGRSSCPTCSCTGYTNLIKRSFTCNPTTHYHTCCH